MRFRDAAKIWAAAAAGRRRSRGSSPRSRCGKWKGALSDAHTANDQTAWGAPHRRHSKSSRTRTSTGRIRRRRGGRPGPGVIPNPRNFRRAGLRSFFAQTCRIAVLWFKIGKFWRPIHESNERTHLMAVVEMTAASLPELVSAALEIQASLPEGRFLWFRGLHCDSHSLVPKLMRDGKTIEQVYERERRLITRFQQRSMAYWPEGYPQTDWEHLFAMQHYGLPTRLLDWSENLFVAAYFALNAQCRSQHDPPRCTPVVWCIDPVAWNRSTPHLGDFAESINVLTTVDTEHADSYRPNTTKRRPRWPVTIFGSHNSVRIVAQRGTFFVWGGSTESLEHFAGVKPEALLWRIALTRQAAELYSDLHAIGFGETMIFPELSSLATELERTEGWR
jgi:hypothetical protein